MDFEEVEFNGVRTKAILDADKYAEYLGVEDEEQIELISEILVLELSLFMWRTTPGGWGFYADSIQSMILQKQDQYYKNKCVAFKVLNTELRDR